MSNFLIVLKFELMHYFKNKVFLITSIVLIGLLSIGLTIPTIMESFEDEEGADGQGDETPVYGLYDPEGHVDDLE